MNSSMLRIFNTLRWKRLLKHTVLANEAFVSAI
jgi:hypothetical protein